MNGIRFTRNTQITRSFGKLLAGSPTRTRAPVAWLSAGGCSSSQVTSATSIPFSEYIFWKLKFRVFCYS